MSGILNTLLTVGVLVFGVVAFQHRCDWFQFCGDLGPAPAAAAEVPVVVDEAGSVVAAGSDETASNLDENGNFDRSSGAGCCVCAMQGDRVKCQKHGGAWYNPPALNGQSNDQSVELSLQACNATCGSSSTSPADREKTEVKGVKCPSGYSSVNGKCVKLGANRSKGGGIGGSKMSPKPAPKPTPQKITPKKGSGYDTYFKANRKGYKPGGGSYYADEVAQAYMSRMNLTPYTAYRGRLSL